MVKRKNLKQEPSEDPLPQDSSDEEESARKKVRWNAGTDGSTEQDSDNDSQATKKVAYFVLDLPRVSLHWTWCRPLWLYSVFMEA